MSRFGALPETTVKAHAKKQLHPEDGPGRICYCATCVAIMACRELLYAPTPEKPQQESEER